MAFIVDDLFAIFAAVSAVTGAASAIQGAKASSANKRAQRIEREQQNYRIAQERRQSIKQQRIAYAAAEQRANNQGVADSSGAQGGQGSITSQGNFNLAYLNNNSLFANSAGNWMDKAASHAAQASLWGGLSNLAQVGMSFSPTPDWLKEPAAPAAKLPNPYGDSKGFSYPNGYFPQRGG